MKATLHFPTEQYGFAEVEIDVDKPEDAIQAYKRATGQIEGIQAIPEGIPAKEMNAVVDKMLLGESVEDGIEIYERMNANEKYAVQLIKRALKRIEAKEIK